VFGGVTEPVFGWIGVGVDKGEDGTFGFGGGVISFGGWITGTCFVSDNKGLFWFKGLGF